MKLPTAFVLLATSWVLSGCRTPLAEAPETSPEGPPVLDESTMRAALSGPVDFHKHVEPLLRQNCLPSHDGKQMPHLVNLTNRQSAFAKGPYGWRIVPGNPDDSLIVRNLSLTHAPVKSMPPVGSRMTNDEVAILKRWIKAGAQWP